MRPFIYALLILSALSSCQSTTPEELAFEQHRRLSEVSAPEVSLEKAHWLLGSWLSDEGENLKVEKTGTTFFMEFNGERGQARLYALADKQLRYEESGQNWRVVWTGDKDLRMESLSKETQEAISWVKQHDGQFYLIRHSAGGEKVSRFKRNANLLP